MSRTKKIVASTDDAPTPDAPTNDAPNEDAPNDDATKDDAPTNDDAPTKENASDDDASTETEKPPESLLKRLVRIVAEETGDGIVADASALLALSRQGTTLAKNARRKEEASQNATSAVAQVIVSLRLSVLLKNGAPDIAGATRSYKTAVHPIYEAYRLEDEDEITAFNRVNRAVQRLLPVSVALFAAEATDGLSVSETDVRSIVKNGEKSAVSDDAATRTLVAATEALYEAQYEGKTRPKNAPRSPFVAKETKEGTSPPVSDDEKKGKEKYEALHVLRSALTDDAVTLDVLLPEVVRVMQAVDKRMSKRTPHYGDGGKEFAESLLLHVEAIARGRGKRSAGATLTTDEDASYRVALEVTFSD